MSCETIQEAFESVLKEAICLVKVEKEHAIQKLEKSEGNLTFIQSWIEQFVSETTKEIDVLNDQLTQLNEHETCLTADEKKLLEIQIVLNTEKNELITPNETLESKLDSLMQKENNADEHLEKNDKKAGFKVKGLFKALTNKDPLKLLTDLTTGANLKKLYEVVESKIEKSQLSKESKGIDVLKNQILNLINGIEKNTEDINQVQSCLLNAKLKINTTKENRNSKMEYLKISEKLIIELRTILSKVTQLKTMISSNVDYKNQDKTLPKELSVVICQVLEAQKEFFKMKKKSYETVQEVFQNVLNDAISLSNDDNKDQAVLKLEKGELNLTSIQSWLEQFANETKKEIDALNDQLIQLNHNETGLTVDEKKLLEAQTVLNTEKNGLITLISPNETLESKLNSLALVQMENDVDENLEKSDKKAGVKVKGLFKALTNKDPFKLLTDLTTGANLKKLYEIVESKIEKSQLSKESEKIDENKQEKKNSIELSGIQNEILDVRRVITDIEENIKNKGQILTTSSNSINDLQAMHDKFNYLKNDLLLMNEYEWNEKLEMKEFVERIFKAQRHFNSF